MEYHAPAMGPWGGVLPEGGAATGCPLRSLPQQQAWREARKLPNAQPLRRSRAALVVLPQQQAWREARKLPNAQPLRWSRAALVVLPQQQAWREARKLPNTQLPNTQPLR